MIVLVPSFPFQAFEISTNSDPRDPRDCVHDQSTPVDIKRYIEGRMHEEGEKGREERKEGAKPKPRQVSRRTQLKVGATRSGEGGTRDGTVLSSFFFFFFPLSQVEDPRRSRVNGTIHWHFIIASITRVLLVTARQFHSTP